MAEHGPTPTPWRLIDTISSAGVYAIERNEFDYGDFDPETGKYAAVPMFDRVIVSYGHGFTSATPIEHANAALIVCAVNSHAAMVEALKIARPFVEYSFDATDGEESAEAEHVMESIAAALALAEAAQ